MFEKFFKFGFISIMFGYLTIIGILITFGLKFLFQEELKDEKIIYITTNERTKR